MTTRAELSHEAGCTFAADERTEPQSACHVDHASELPAHSIGDTWPADLTRRLRVLLHTLPLGGLRRSDTIRDAEFRHYDSLALALRVLDVVIDRLGLEAEADRDVVARVLRRVLSAMDTAAGIDPSPERHERMLAKLLGGLRNDGDARRPFREEYTAVNREREAQRLALALRLLFDAFHPSGRTVLRPSVEASISTCGCRPSLWIDDLAAQGRMDGGLCPDCGSREEQLKNNSCGHRLKDSSLTPPLEDPNRSVMGGWI